jgi:hypothetical protein
MTLRALFIFAGVLTFTPAVAFLILFRPPSGTFLSRMRNGQDIGTWWVGASLRLLAAGLAAGGFRIMVSNLLNRNKPVAFIGWFDEVTILSTLILAALASALFFFVYLAFRLWPAEEPEEYGR